MLREETTESAKESEISSFSINSFFFMLAPTVPLFTPKNCIFPLFHFQICDFIRQIEVCRQKKCVLAERRNIRGFKSENETERKYIKKWKVVEWKEENYYQKLIKLQPTKEMSDCQTGK